MSMWKPDLTYYDYYDPSTLNIQRKMVPQGATTNTILYGNPMPTHGRDEIRPCDDVSEVLAEMINGCNE